MRILLQAGLVGLGMLAVATTASAQSDVIEGPLIRPAVSSSDPRDLSGVWFIRLYNRQINSTLGRLPAVHGEGQGRVGQARQGGEGRDRRSPTLPRIAGLTACRA